MSATVSSDDNSANESLGRKRYKHPFTVDGDRQYLWAEDDDPTDKDTPRTLVELRMCALSAAIRAKLEWWVKFRDENVRAKWTEEIKEQQKNIHRSLQMTDNMVPAIEPRVSCENETGRYGSIV